MCNSCNRCGSNRCGCNRCGSNRCGCRRNWENNEWDFWTQDADDCAFVETERIVREVENRRCREDRCARQFNHCMNRNCW